MEYNHTELWAVVEVSNYHRHLDTDVLTSFRTHRRTFDEHFRANAVPKFYPVQMRQVGGLLKRLLDTPEDFRYHIRQCVFVFLAQ